MQCIATEDTYTVDMLSYEAGIIIEAVDYVIVESWWNPIQFLRDTVHEFVLQIPKEENLWRKNVILSKSHNENCEENLDAKNIIAFV